MAIRLKLREKFIFVFVALSLAILISMGIVVVLLVSGVQENAVFDLERQLISLKIREAEAFIQDIRGLSRYKIEPYYDSILKISDASRDFLVRGVLEENAAVEDVALLTLEGTQAFRRSRGRALPFTIPELNDPSLVPLYAADSVRGALEKGEYLSPFYYVVDVPKITLAYPVLNEVEEQVGILRVVVNLSDLKNIIARDRLGPNEEGYVVAVDKEGNIFSHSRRDGLFTREAFSSSPTHEVVEYMRRVRGIPQLERTEEYQNIFGEEVMALAKVAPTLDWVVIAEWPRDDAMGVVRELVARTVLFAVIAFIAIVLITVVLVRRVTQPLHELSRGASIIGRGNLKHRIKIKTGDELEELGNAFNTMAQDLKEVERLREVEIRAKALKETLEREQQLSKLKDTFIATASHQFRTPLSVIRWSIDLIQTQKERVRVSAIREQLKDIFENTMKLVVIADDLLTVAEFGLGTYQKKNINDFAIGEEVKNIIKAYSKRIEEKKIDMRFTKPKEEITLKVNVRAIHAVIKNLIDNAVTYTRENGKVLVALEKEEGAIRFSVTDDGIGIPKKDQKYVFNQFFRATNAVEGKNVGTGLGLYIIKNIVTGHRGDIGFYSEEGKGTTFWFILPLR